MWFNNLLQNQWAADVSILNFHIMPKEIFKLEEGSCAFILLHVGFAEAAVFAFRIRC
jgi:hypothetical protein